ncbi:vWA domain-containing protein [Aestuariivirga litoralis]|nr:VWA domain-containing protein [Aestuariivirga litoralis]
MINLTLKPLRDGMPAGEAFTTEVLLRITPEAMVEDGRRANLNLALVIDRSGSMAGRPLHEAKRCAAMVIDRLTARDRLAIVAYDDQVEVMLPSSPVDDRERFKRAVSAILDGGTTNLHGGWHAGATAVARAMQLVPNGLSRVLLLSDGQANQGETNTAVIASHCAELAAADVSTSTYGLGESFNEDLMTQMARAGQGQSHYGRSAEDLIDPFQQEFDLLQALVARRLRLEVLPERGVKVDVLNLFTPDPETGALILPDLAAGGELWAVLRLKVEAGVSLGSAPARLLTARLRYVDRDDHRHATDPVALHLGPLSPAAYAALPAEALVRDRTGELEVAHLADLAREAARHGDWQRVETLTAEMLERAAGNEWVAESVRSLRELAQSRNREGFSKEALYKSTRMRSRMASLDESTTSYGFAEESAKPSFLRRKREEGRRFDADDDGPVRPSTP